MCTSRIKVVTGLVTAIFGVAIVNSTNGLAVVLGFELCHVLIAQLFTLMHIKLQGSQVALAIYL